jgi:DNA replication protein DnaC
MSAEAPTAPATSRPAETLEQSLVRLTDCVGHLNPKRWGKHAEIARTPFELPRMLPMNVYTLAALVQLPEANEVITAECNQCHEPIECRRIVAPFVACDPCIKKAKDAVAMEKHRRHWEATCPELYRKTDTKHADFPLAVWNQVKADFDANPGQSFFFFGPSGTAKTRTGMLLLKRALLRRNVELAVIWPEKLPNLTQRAFDNAETYFDRMAKVGLLLLDDALLTACREPKLMDAVKLLLDARMRVELPTVFTSQIGSEEDLTQGKEYGEAKGADVERIKALLRRLREKCKVVNFSKVEPKEGEGSF